MREIDRKGCGMKTTKEEALDFLDAFYMGRHHYNPHRLKPWGFGWQITHGNSLATFDFDSMTRLVRLAHERCMRVEINPCNMRYLRIILHKRKREGSICDRHPTIEQAFPHVPTDDNAATGEGMDGGVHS